MITLIEALNYRCLRYVRQPLGPLHVLVGANASGKSTFLDVVAFLHDLVTKGLDETVALRSSNFYDLVWQHEGDGFELAIEVQIPERIGDANYDTIRYAIRAELDRASNVAGIVAEQATLHNGSSAQPPQREGLGDPASVRESLFQREIRSDARFLFGQPVDRTHFPNLQLGTDLAVLAAEGMEFADRAGRVMRPDLKKCLLACVPEDDSKYPASCWLKRVLSEEVEPLALETRQLLRPGAPGQGVRLKSDGSNLPWVIWDLCRQAPERFQQWIEHLQTALPGLTGITTIERPEDRHRYLSLEYRDGLQVPSWMVSDGTLRLLALTLPAYLPGFDSTLLLEEPENGLHPLAIETVYQSLSSVYDGQVLLATHSPMMVAIAKPSEVLCFSADEHGAVQILSGSEHPRLRDWRGEVDLGTLFASGVLG